MGTLQPGQIGLSGLMEAAEGVGKPQLSPLNASNQMVMIEQLTAVIGILVQERGGALVIDGTEFIRMIETDLWTRVTFVDMRDPWMMKISVKDS